MLALGRWPSPSLDISRRFAGTGAPSDTSSRRGWATVSARTPSLRKGRAVARLRDGWTRRIPCLHGRLSCIKPYKAMASYDPPPTDRSPVFVQFLDVLHQVMLQFPCAFEYSGSIIISEYMSRWAPLTPTLSLSLFLLCRTSGSRRSLDFLGRPLRQLFVRELPL